MPIEIFFSYAHEDEDLMNEVRRQLVIYERMGKIVKWHDRQIPAGIEWAPDIDGRLRQSHVILLFVSPAFLESRYCWDVEVKVALERHERGEARVVPVILKPCPWEAAPFAKIQALPRDAKPLTQFQDRDQATLEIARSIIQVVDELLTSPPCSARPADSPKKRGVYRRALDGDR
ncbi:MAG TPA: toll/interleukin-1 receptor domain-containing protein, partial [Acidobacteriaceae bacterium]|nr:toll/interleukin-1 receptor domain-containing protein [Acidobacteriaceae bacterium]